MCTSPALSLLLFLLLFLHQVEFADNKGSAVIIVAPDSPSVSWRLTIAGIARFLRNGDSAVFVVNSASLTLADAEFIGNVASTGIGDAIQMVGAASSLTVTGRLLVQGNRAGRDGGGIAVIGGGVLALLGETLMTDNSAGETGGAVFLVNGKLTVSGAVRLSQNRAGSQGGAVWMVGSQATVEAPSGSLCISGNSAVDAGGGVYMADTAQLRLNSDADAAGGNTPDDIAVGPSGLPTAGFSCSDGTLRSEGTYSVDGLICSCPAPAVAGASVTCATCPPASCGWCLTVPAG
jgi:hypothetical protein